MTMQTATVAPGQNGTFVFDYTAPTVTGTYQDYFAPTVENIVKMADIGMAFTVTVPPAYGYQFVAATNPPRTMSKGQVASVSVTLKNTGSTAWRNEAGSPSTPFRLYTTRSSDHANPFGGGAGWVGRNRMTMQTSSAGYGENAVFTYDYTAPQIIGTYEEFFAPTVENIYKLPDTGMEFVTTVQ